MTNKKTTKRALMMSVVSLFLCFTMLLGTTYAWFTDSGTSSGNKIMAGTLDIKLFMHTENGAVEITNESDPIFGAAGLAQDDAAATLYEVIEELGGPISDEIEDEPEKEKSGGVLVPLIIAVVAVLGIAGILIYLYMKKKKQVKYEGAPIVDYEIGDDDLL